MPREKQVRPAGFRDTWVSASELGSHMFCARSAWLSASGEQTSEQGRLSSGQKHHAFHGRVFRAQNTFARAALWVLAVAACVALVYVAVRWWAT